MESLKEIKEQYKASLKSMDTEEHIDLAFYRPLGYLWAKLCAALGITPNAITIASIFLGVAGGFLLYFGQKDTLWLNYVGIFLIIWANTFDSADGQLARLTQQYSRIGRILDGLSGDFWFVAIYFAIVFRELDFGDVLLGEYFGDHAWMIWTLAIVAGASHAKQAASADYYRQFHLYFLKGKDGSELDSTEQLTEQYEELSWGQNFMKKLTLFFYRNYTANQEVLTPNMQKLRRELKAKFGEDEISQKFRDDFRAKSLPMMKYTNMLSFNLRIIVMFLSVIAQMPWIYFAFEIVVLNSMMAYMIITHEKFCGKFVNDLKNGKY